MPAPLSSATTLKRIQREMADLKKEDLGAITLTPSDNLFNWKATIPGPEGSCYEGGVFNIDIHLSHDYPFSAPKVAFLTRIYHMNINDRGNICIDILKHNWSPALSLFKVILSLSSLLTDPNPRDPLVPSIATEYVRNRTKHDQTAKRWTELYARPPPTAIDVSGSEPKGKARAVASPSASSSSSTHIGRSAANEVSIQEHIVIEDDSDSGDARSTTNRASRRSGVKRKRGTEITTTTDIDLVSDEDDRPETRRRKRDDASCSLPDEVIVIED